MLVLGLFALAVGLFVLSIFIDGLTTFAMGTFFSFSGSLIQAAAIRMGVKATKFARIARSTVGGVVGHEQRLEERNDSERLCYFPRVEFETEDHEKHVFTDESDNATYHVGQSIGVLYDPNRPQVADIKKDLWGGLVVAILFGLLFLLPGIWFLLVGFGVLPGNIHWE